MVSFCKIAARCPFSGEAMRLLQNFIIYFVMQPKSTPVAVAVAVAIALVSSLRSSILIAFYSSRSMKIHSSPFCLRLEVDFVALRFFTPTLYLQRRRRRDSKKA